MSGPLCEGDSPQCGEMSRSDRGVRLRKQSRRIRASDRPDHDVPIFAMTANTFAADRKKCYDAGMSGYIPKPIDLETITHVLEEETGE